MNSRATIDQVAAAAGVGKSTVSRVLNGSSAVSPEARAAVERAIEELNYAPSRMARSLALKHSHALALIVPEDLDRFFLDPFFAEIMKGITGRLQSSEYVLNLMVASGPVGSESANKVASFVRNGGVDGAFVISHHTGDTFLRSVIGTVPVVFGGRADPYTGEPGVYFVDTPNVQGGYLAGSHLVQRGAKRIATITGAPDIVAAHERTEGFRTALAEAGLEPVAVLHSDFSARSGTDAARQLLASGVEFDSIFVANDIMAIAVMQVLRDAGRRVPEDVLVVGYDDIKMARESDPPLTTIRQPLRQVGYTMADVMLQVLGKENPPSETFLPSELVVRESA